LSVLHEDAHLLAVNKPAGVASQGLGATALEWAVRRHLAPDDPGGVYLGAVHRLDRPVTGVMLWAKDPKSARRLAEQFADRRARKVYWALVEGRPNRPSGRWDDWLCEEDTGLGRVQVCRHGTPRARQATTHFVRLEGASPMDDVTWLELRPETGRTHQIRVQAASRGWPIVGDAKYGSARPFAVGIALHARSLTVVHPTLRSPLTYVAPLPESWRGSGCLVGDSVSQG
jgi:23S rRNA pseudouridine1911/1915/1917 synthase